MRIDFQNQSFTDTNWINSIRTEKVLRFYLFSLVERWSICGKPNSKNEKKSVSFVIWNWHGNPERNLSRNHSFIWRKNFKESVELKLVICLCSSESGRLPNLLAMYSLLGKDVIIIELKNNNIQQICYTLPSFTWNKQKSHKSY